MEGGLSIAATHRPISAPCFSIAILSIGRRLSTPCDGCVICILAARSTFSHSILTTKNLRTSEEFTRHLTPCRWRRSSLANSIAGCELEFLPACAGEDSNGLWQSDRSRELGALTIDRNSVV